MTCIVGCHSDGKVWIGGDAAGVGGTVKSVRLHSKVFILDNRFVIGYSGSFRFGQIVQFQFSPPPHPSKKADYDYMATDWLNALRAVLKEAGFTKVEDGVETLGEASALIGYKGRLYELESDFQIGEAALPYAATGSGSEVAMGSMHTSYELRRTMKPTERIKLALQAASEFCVGVCPPFTIGKLTTSGNCSVGHEDEESTI